MPGTARIVRDERGGVVRVVYDGDARDGGGGGGREKGKGVRVWRGRRLVDEMGSDEDDEEHEEEEDGVEGGGGTQHDLLMNNRDLTSDVNGGKGDVVTQLAKIASMTGEKKRPRKQSQREEEWVERLVERYGDDVGKMARDRKLNPMQQSQGDIAKRVRMWRQGRRKGGGNHVRDVDEGMEMETEME